MHQPEVSGTVRERRRNPFRLVEARPLLGELGAQRREAAEQPGAQIVVDAGAAFCAARGIPHVYRVESETARWLTFSEPAGFEAFVLEASTPAERDELPPVGRAHDPVALDAAAARQGIELLGPPGTLP